MVYFHSVRSIAPGHHNCRQKANEIEEQQILYDWEQVRQNKKTLVNATYFFSSSYRIEILFYEKPFLAAL